MNAMDQLPWFAPRLFPIPGKGPSRIGLHFDVGPENLLGCTPCIVIYRDLEPRTT